MGASFTAFTSARWWVVAVVSKMLGIKLQQLVVRCGTQQSLLLDGILLSIQGLIQGGSLYDSRESTWGSRQVIMTTG